MKEALSEVLGRDLKRLELLQQGQIGGIYIAGVEDQHYVVKHSEEREKLAIEAQMLVDLYKAKIRVPRVIISQGPFLVLEHIETINQPKVTRETEAAMLLGRLHSVTNESRMYGYYYDTTIGPFPQKNEQTQYNWTLFLGQMRIIPMARHCYDKGKITKEMVDRLEGLCRDLYKRIDMYTIYPSLLHGDVWGGNVLFEKEGACLIDPAIYYGDKEMELAFIRLFGTFGETFFNVYQEIHTLSDDFYESKEPIYQIYPILVHVALYGGSYIEELERILKRLKV